MIVMIMATRCVEAGSEGGRREATVEGSHCSYTLVVNEFDISKCPTMQQDSSSSLSSSSSWGYAPSSSRHHKQRHYKDGEEDDVSFAGSDTDGRRGRIGGSGSGGDKEVRV
jgi:hypothetical protein